MFSSLFLFQDILLQITKNENKSAVHAVHVKTIKKTKIVKKVEKKIMSNESLQCTYSKILQHGKRCCGRSVALLQKDASRGQECRLPVLELIADPVLPPPSLGDKPAILSPETTEIGVQGLGTSKGRSCPIPPPDLTNHTLSDS